MKSSNKLKENAHLSGENVHAAQPKLAECMLMLAKAQMKLDQDFSPSLINSLCDLGQVA